VQRAVAVRAYQRGAGPTLDGGQGNRRAGAVQNVEPGVARRGAGVRREGAALLDYWAVKIEGNDSRGRCEEFCQKTEDAYSTRG
jgi:hypothetical protein